MNKSIIWKLILFIGLSPFVAPFIYYLVLQIVHNQYSWTLFELLVLWSFVYWPTYIVGLVLIFLSAYKIHKITNNSI